MEIQAIKLKELLELLKPAVPKKPTLGVTAYVCMGNGKAVATDLETMIIADLPEAQEPMLIPFASVAEMIKYVPGVNTVRMDVRGKTLNMEWEGGTASYPTEDWKDYPPVPELAVKAEAFLDGDTLMAAMLAALPYVATEEGRPILTGVALTLGTPIDVDAGDGFRMAHQVLGRLSFPINQSAVVPGHSVSILGHVFAKTPRTPPTNATSLIPIITAKRQLRVALEDENKFRVDFGKASVVVNLVDGTPPNFVQLIPKGEPILQSQLFAPQMEAAVRRVAGIAKDGSGIVRLEFANGKVTISAKSEEQEISAVVDAVLTQGEPGRTAINYIYLLDYLAKKEGVFVMTQYDKTGPVVFEYQNTPKVLIMPMFVQWDDEKPPEAEKTETPADEVETSPEGATEEGAESSVDDEEAGENNEAPDSEQLPESIGGDGSIAVASPQAEASPETAPMPKKKRRKKKLATT